MSKRNNHNNHNKHIKSRRDAITSITINTFSKIKKLFHKKGRCRHVGSQLVTRNNIRLPCCSGSSSACKQKTIDMLGEYNLLSL